MGDSLRNVSLYSSLSEIAAQLIQSAKIKVLSSRLGSPRASTASWAAEFTKSSKWPVKNDVVRCDKLWSARQDTKNSPTRFLAPAVGCVTSRSAWCRNDFIVLIICGNKMASVIFNLNQPPLSAERKRPQLTPIMKPKIKVFARHFKRARSDVFWWKDSRSVLKIQIGKH